MKLIRRPAPDDVDLSDSYPELLGRILARRGIRDADEMCLDLSALQPVSGLKSIDRAADMLCQSLRQQSTIVVVGDFDADGATATAVVLRALSQMGHKAVHYLVPNRFEYGYGLTPEIVKEATRYKPKLVMTVDNGISSCTGVKAARSLGCEVIITDHHLPGKQLPAADAIVNPNQPGDTFASKNLSGVGVAFYLMLAVKYRLQQEDYFTQQKLAVPNLASLLDLVALGTVADVVPMDQNNRILVEQGLRRIRNGKSCAGIRALFQIARRDWQQAVSADLGFVCGPRLNAAGRLDDMSLGIECLLTDSDEQALSMAGVLDDLNKERKAIEESMKTEALESLADLVNEIPMPDLAGSLINSDDQNRHQAATSQKQDQAVLPAVICLYEKDWHQGVVGIVAARIREKYHRPAIVFAAADISDARADTHVNRNMELKGSARSIPGLHIRDVLDSVANRYPGLLNKFGGHAMAAGLSLELSRLDDFRQAVCQVALEMAGADTFLEQVYSDGELETAEFDLTIADLLRYAAPWGQHFPTPAFDNRFIILQRRVLKEKHLRLVLRPLFDTTADEQLHRSSTNEMVNRTVTAMAFNTNPDEWPADGEEVHLLYQLDVNEYRGNRSLQLIVQKRLF